MGIQADTSVRITVTCDQCHHVAEWVQPTEWIELELPWVNLGRLDGFSFQESVACSRACAEALAVKWADATIARAEAKEAPAVQAVA